MLVSIFVVLALISQSMVVHKNPQLFFFLYKSHEFFVQPDRRTYYFNRSLWIVRKWRVLVVV